MIPSHRYRGYGEWGSKDEMNCSDLLASALARSP
jgi:hypothetical protein